MEAQQTEKAYGEGFRIGVSRVLEELEKVSFLPKDVHQKLTQQAAKLCLAEALIEKEASDVKARAVKEWQTQAPEIKAAIKRIFPNAL